MHGFLEPMRTLQDLFATYFLLVVVFCCLFVCFVLFVRRNKFPGSLFFGHMHTCTQCTHEEHRDWPSCLDRERRFYHLEPFELLVHGN